MSDDTKSSTEQPKPEVDPKRLEKYAEMLEACGEGSNARRGMHDLLDLAVKASSGDSHYNHMKVLEFGFSLLRRFRREEGERQAAFNAEFSQAEQAVLGAAHRSR